MTRLGLTSLRGLPLALLLAAPLLAAMEEMGEDAPVHYSGLIAAGWTLQMWMADVDE